ncbi:MAG: Ig-like domain-containing protein, partial [Pygmaiobacter sp.]|nr:Ig-like domain-containing protein [Pygmaiobacter sp.]
MQEIIRKIKKSDFADKVTLLVAMVLLTALFTFFNKNYFSFTNLINVLIACSLIGFVAIGETNLVIANQVDLAAGSVAACAGVIAALLTRAGMNAFFALLVAVLAGALVGAVNAALVTFLRLQPFIATLATMSIVRGFAYILCNGKAVAVSDKTFIKFGNYRVFGFLPVPVLLLIITFIIFSVVLSKTYFGRSIYVLGGNAYAARLAGLNPTQMLFKMHIIESSLAAFAGVLLAARMNSGQPSACVGLEFDATLTLVSGGITATNGTATVQDGQIKFTPAANFNGIASVTYTVTDGTVQKMATITITVTPVNDAPALQGVTSITAAEDTVVANTFVTDVDNSELTFTLTTPPAHGTVTFEQVAGASVTTYRYLYTPVKDYYGTDTFTVKVSDGAATVTRSISFTFTAVNDAPTFDGLAAVYNISEDDPQQTVNFTIADAETATSALMLQVSSQNEALIPAASLTLDGLGASDGNVTLHYTPAANAHGTAVLQLKLSDGFLVTTQNVTVQVASVNDAPTPVADTLEYTEDTPLVIDMDDLVANDKDIDGDTLTFTGVNTLPGAAVGTLVETNAASHEWTFTPVANTNETATFTYFVSDGDLQSVGQVTLTAKGVNDRPTLVLDAGNIYTTNEDTGLDIIFTVNDLETDASDLIVLAGTGTPGVVGADRLTITRGANGQCTLHIAPNADQNGTATITLTVSDSKLMAATSFDIAVTPVQDPPVGVNDYVFAAKMGKVEFEPLANDTDPDGDTLSIASYTQPVGGQVTQDGDKLVFRDTLGTVRVTTFTYTVSDGHGNTAEATVNVSVGGASFPPSITPVAAQYINEDTTTTTLAFTVADPEGAPLTVSAQSDNTTLLPNDFTSNILLTQNTDGSCTVQLVPAANANGTATVTLSVSDGDNTTTTSFKLTVYPVNDLPVAADDTVTTNEDTAVTIDVLANDSDLETAHASLRVTDITQPTHGRLALAGTGKYTYTPYANFNGSDSFTYTMTDGQADATATVNITVDAVNDAPRIWRDIWRSLASTTETTPVDIAFIQSGIVGDVDNTLDELY